MRRLWMSGAAAVMAISVAGVQAQTTGTQTPTQPPQTQTQANQETTTLKGCVYQEKDVPGRTPNVAERAGILEDYILVTSQGAHDATAGRTGTPATPPTGTVGTTGAMSAHKAFKLEKASDDQLRSMVGKMVEVTGKIDAERSDRAAGAATGTAGEPARDRSLGPDQIELPEFEVTSIREVEGTCPATPDIKK